MTGESPRCIRWGESGPAAAAAAPHGGAAIAAPQRPHQLFSPAGCPARRRSGAEGNPRRAAHSAAAEAFAELRSTAEWAASGGGALRGSVGRRMCGQAPRAARRAGEDEGPIAGRRPRRAAGGAAGAAMPLYEGLGSGGEKTAVVLDLGAAFTK